MKRKGSQAAIETHDISQNRYTVPGSELGKTNACPFDEAVDVDASGGYQSEYCLGKGDDCSHFSYVDRDKCEELVPANNPTRMKRKLPSWMTQPATPSRSK